jgi:hypothetical protein
MSLAPDAKLSVPAARAVSPIILIAAMLLTAVTTAGIVLAAGRLSAKKPTDLAPTVEATPFAQQGSVKPEGRPSGMVYYPLPYSSPPHLTLSPGGRYLLARQDELGFTWVDRQRLKDAPDLTKEFPDLGRLGTPPKADDAAAGPQPELTWEVKGVRAGAAAGATRLFQQTGTFQFVPDEEGEVYFPFPYAQPPNVEVTTLESVIVSGNTAFGFTWKVPYNTRRREGGTATWTAKGIRATPADLEGEVNRARSRPAAERLFRQTGKFAPNGMAGEVQFPVPFAAGPYIELYVLTYNETYFSTKTTVTESKPTGFKWKNSEANDSPYPIRWIAKGSRAGDTPK